MEDVTKTCKKCNELKTLDRFRAEKRNSDGLSGICRDCENKYQREYTKKNRERRRVLCNARVKKYYQSHKDGILGRAKARYDENPERHREKTRKWREKMSDEERREYYRKSYKNRDRFIVALETSARHAKKYGYMPCTATLQEIKDAYTGVCGICGVPEQECTSKFHLDHDHNSGAMRGWLCSACNKGIGFLRDSEDLLINALHWIMNPQFANK